MKRFCLAYSKKEKQEEAYAEVSKQLKKGFSSPKLIIFSTTTDHFYYFATYLKRDFPKATVIGCTSCDNLSSLGFSDKGATALGIYSGIDFSTGIIFEIHRHPNNYIVHLRNALSHFTSYENMCCLEFMNSFTKGEELVLDTLSYELGKKNIPVIGSSAGLSDFKEQSLVSLNGDVFVNTCVFVLIKNLKGKIYTYKENLFKETGKSVVTTDVDCDERIIYELNDKPAADVLADKLKVSLDLLPDSLKSHPLGRTIGNELYITETGQIHEDGSVFCYSQVYNNTKLSILEMDNIQETWEKTVANVKPLVQKTSFMFVVNCSLRANLFKDLNCYNDFWNTLNSICPSYIGVSGFGEQLNTVNLNQSMILLIFE